MLFVASAIVFLVVIIFTKNGWTILKRSQNSSGLAYDGILIGDLVNQDTNKNKIPDWEEKLLSPEQIQKDLNTPATPSDEKLTQTEKFSRDFFATAATLSQTGAMDQQAVDNLNTTLLEKIQNPIVKKIYSISDLKTTADISLKTFTTYNNALISVFTKNPIKTDISAILTEFVNDGTNENVAALKKLDPVIKQTNIIINEMLAVKVPNSLSQLHLDVINSLERVVENLNDIEFYDTDPIVSMGGISAYEENTSSLESSIIKLGSEITKKLKN